MTAGLPAPSEAQLASLAHRLWKLPEREYQYFGCDYAIAAAGDTSPDFLETWRWLVTHKSWWDTVDALAIGGVGSLVRRRRAPESEFFVRKAIGWTLREYSKTAPRAVRRFVREDHEVLSPLSRREALKWLGRGERKKGRSMSSNAEKALEIFQKHIGEEQGPGEWHTIDQAQINAFADSTLDHQFIHIDPEKSAELSPYKVTIAHGFLTLSMVVHLGKTVPPVDEAAYQGVIMGVNYGLDKVRFPNPVKVDSRVRGRSTLVSAELKAPNTIQLKQAFTVEIENEAKPGCAAETLTRLIYS